MLDSTPGRLRSELNFDEEIENGLYPIVTMVKPVRQRFVFHFEGDRGTNRLDKVRSPYFFLFVCRRAGIDDG